MKRMLTAYQTLKRDAGFDSRGVAMLLPTSDEEDPEFFLRVESQLPEPMRPWYDARTFEMISTAAERHHLAADVRRRIDARFAEALAAEPVTEETAAYCRNLVKRIDGLEKKRVAGLAQAQRRMCWCLDGGRTASDGSKRQLADRALAHGVSCRCPIDARKTRTSLTFGWKQGQTPRNYGPYADRKATFTVDVDPAWHSCAQKYREPDLNLDVRIYGGATADQALTAKRPIAEIALPFQSPHDSRQFDGRLLCESQPAFVAYELGGKSELAALGDQRVVVPIHCE
jgi:hypothetical protein